jgi:hypothetical protein
MVAADRPCCGHDGAVVRAVFIFEGGDLTVRTSLGGAAGHVEAIDVDNGEFDFYAEDGAVIVGTVHDQQVILTQTGHRRIDELQHRLRRYLSAMAIDPGLADDPVVAAQAILNEEWKRRPFRWFPWLDRRANGPNPPVV